MTVLPKPQWLRVRPPTGERYARLRDTLEELGLHTVCEQACCPNLGECWQQGTATLMLLGDTCTRGCRFCAVQAGDPGGRVDGDEPEKAALAVERMALDYVVLTMVNRDDLSDGGAAQVVDTIRRIRQRVDSIKVEALVGDFAGRHRDVLTVVEKGRPDVYAHNAEVVPALQRSMRDARCSWERSLKTLRWARQAGAPVTKSSLMVGCGETEQQVLDAMLKLREAGVQLLTIGQYLRPSRRHAPVTRYLQPSEFDAYGDAGLRMGFGFVASGPLVRSSYRAAEVFVKGIRASRRVRKAAS